MNMCHDEHWCVMNIWCVMNMCHDKYMMCDEHMTWKIYDVWWICSIMNIWHKKYMTWYFRRRSVRRDNANGRNAAPNWTPSARNAIRNAPNSALRGPPRRQRYKHSSTQTCVWAKPFKPKLKCPNNPSPTRYYCFFPLQEEEEEKEEVEEKEEESGEAIMGESAVAITTTTTELDTSQESIKTTEDSITTTEAKSPASQGLYQYSTLDTPPT